MSNAKTITFATDVELGHAAASEIYDGIQDAERNGRKYVLGCPGGRSPRSTFSALATLVSAEKQSISHVYIAMMDEYAVQLPHGDFRNVEEESHFSCRGFAFHEIRNVLNAGLELELQLPYEHVLVPDAANPEAYEDLLRTFGIDCFLLASGATDGHVAFNGSGTPRAALTRVTVLAEATRRDNLLTFPDFTSLAEVPTFGVSVGPETIASVSKKAIMLLQGAHKQEAFRRISSALGYEPDWPATIISECRNPQIFADSEAATSI